MKLINDRYEIEYIDSYINGIEVDWFKVKIGNVILDIEYSQEQKDIITCGINRESRVIESNDKDGEDVSYIYEEANTLECFKYARYEIKKVCDFMIDLM